MNPYLLGFLMIPVLGAVVVFTVWTVNTTVNTIEKEWLKRKEDDRLDLAKKIAIELKKLNEKP